EGERCGSRSSVAKNAGDRAVSAASRFRSSRVRGDGGADGTRRGMTVLQVADLRFGFAGDTIFEGVTFSLALGERAALVAPHGAGKSTLLRLIGKEMDPDAGQVVVRRDVSVGYYRQSHELSASGDVMGAFLSSFGEVVALREELSRAQHDA